MAKIIFIVKQKKKKLAKYLNTSNGFYFYSDIVVFQQIKGSNYIDIREI